MTVRVALVGAGAMGAIMARDIYPAVADRLAVVAVVDRDPERRHAVARALDARGYASLADARSAEPLDAVDVRVQHGAHADVAVEALEGGMHVLVEKPLAGTLDDCARIASAARRAGTVVAVAENYPHLRAVQAAQGAIRDGSIGDVLAVQTVRAYTLSGVWAQSSWRQGSDPMSGVLWDQGTHHTSLLRSLVGEVRNVSARRAEYRHHAGAEVVTLELHFDSGVIGQSLYCWGTPGHAPATEGVVLGTGGEIEITVDYSGESGQAGLSTPEGSHDISAGESYYDSHRLILEDWITAIDEGRAPLVTLESATMDVRVVAAAHESLRRAGAQVSIADAS